MKVEGSRKGLLGSLANWPGRQNEWSALILRSVDDIRALRLVCDTLDVEPCTVGTVGRLGFGENSLAIAGKGGLTYRGSGLYG